MRRPRKQKTGRTNLVSFALTSDEADALIARALARRISVSKLVRQTMNIVDEEDECMTYLVRDEQGRVKIGVTGTLPERMMALQNGNAELLTVVWTRTGNVELAFKRRFKSSRIRNEWYSWVAEMEDFAKPLENQQSFNSTVSQ